jgi:hypothetical protein
MNSWFWRGRCLGDWIPAFAGMTKDRLRGDDDALNSRLHLPSFPRRRESSVLSDGRGTEACGDAEIRGFDLR